MKHLFHSFTDPEQLFPIAGLGQCECAICGKICMKKEHGLIYALDIIS